MADAFELLIKGGDFHFAQVISEAQKKSIISLLLFSEGNPNPITTNTSQQSDPKRSPVTDPNHTLSIREYLNEKKPITIAQKLAALLSYLREFRNQQNVSREDIKHLFVEIQEQIPLNLKRDLKKAIKFGWIAISPNGVDQYFVTASGQQAVDNGFSRLSSRIRVSRVLPGKKVKLTISQKVEELDLQPTKAYWDLNKKDRVLWLLASAKTNDIDALNFKEISHLAQKIGDNIESKQVTSLTVANMQAGRLVSTLSSDGARVIRILQPGIEFITEKTKGRVA